MTAQTSRCSYWMNDLAARISAQAALIGTTASTAVEDGQRYALARYAATGHVWVPCVPGHDRRAVEGGQPCECDEIACEILDELEA